MFVSSALRLLRSRAHLSRGRASCRHKHSWIVPSPYTDVHIPDESITQYLFDLQEQFAHRNAVICGESGQVWTHGEVRSDAIKIGSALTRLGITRGDVVAIVLSNSVEFPVSFLGISAIGACPTLMNPANTQDEMKRQLEDSDSVCVICSKDTIRTVRNVAKNNSNIRHVICVDSEDGDVSFSKMLKDDGKGMPSFLTINPEDDVAVLPYSSGTTGPPKGVMLTHRNLMANLHQSFHPDVTYLTKATGKFQERLLMALPYYHIYAMTLGIFWSVVCGGCVITMKQFDPTQFINLYKKYHPTFLPTVPPMLSFMCASPSFGAELLRESHTHTVLVGAAPVGATLLNKYIQKFGSRTQPVEAFGMTETGPLTHMSQKSNLIMGSCGVPVPNTLTKIVDLKTGEAIGPNEGRGELCIKGPQVMRGYWKNAEATAATITQDGWLRTGDIATMDEGYHVYIVDRLKDLIKVKALQVSPSEVEQVLCEKDGIVDAAVIGVPDERCGQVPKAFIVLTPGASLTKEQVVKHVQDKLSKHKWLAGGIEFVQTLPRNKSGKILRKELQ